MNPNNYAGSKVMVEIPGMVERVAAAMAEMASKPLMNLESLDDVLVGGLGDAWKYVARAAIAAHEAASLNAGMVIVPREATEAMLEVFDDADTADQVLQRASWRSEIWRAMIAAAPRCSTTDPESTSPVGGAGPDDLVPLLVAASRLAHGDDDFTHRYTVEEYVLEVIPNCPRLGESYTRMGQRHTWRELIQAAQQIIALKLDGKIEIYAEKCGDPSGLRHPSPGDLWRLNDVVIAIEPPHEIYRTYERDNGRYGPSTAEWRDPHVRWPEVERLIGGEPLSDAPAAPAAAPQDRPNHRRDG